MSYTVNYNTRLPADRDRAFLDAANYLGTKGMLNVHSMITATTAAEWREQKDVVCFGISMGGVRGFPARQLMARLLRINRGIAAQRKAIALRGMARECN